jgi:hypothetical protein
MPKRIKKFAPGRFDSSQAALSWLKLGIQPVPLRKRSKQPKGGKGWNKMRVTRETIPEFFQSGDNIGGLWGEPSGWIIDVDLDWEEAADVAPAFLPETFVYGRRSRPSTHFLYRCEGIHTIKKHHKDLRPDADPDGSEMIIEIRSTGSQSALPPSIHPDDERYEINHDVPFHTISRKELLLKTSLVAAAALLIRYYPSKGGRHDYIHAIAGSLLWSNWPEDQVRKFMEGLFLGLGNGRDDDIEQRRRTLGNTIEHYKEGDRIHGWKTLSQWVPGDVIKLLKEWLTKEIGQSEEAPLQVNITKAGDKQTTGELNFLKSRIPGLVGDIAEWSHKVSFLKQPMFDIATGLMCTALATTNKYVVDTWDTPLQPYFLLLAPTAAGKDSAMDCVYRFARRVGLGDYVFQGFQSYHSMLDKLGSAPNLACWLWDEAARKLKAASRSASGPDYSVLTWLLSLYGRANSHSPGIPGRNQAITAIDHPFFTVMATAQPTQLMEAITDSDLSTGLINRFIMFDAGELLPDPNLERATMFPARIEEKVKLIRQVETPTGHDPFIKVRMGSSECWALFRDFDTESRLQAFKGGSGEMWGRSNQNALIIAGLIAVGVNPKRPIITDDIAEWSIAMVRWSSSCWMNRVEASGSRSQIEKRSKGVERYIMEASRYTHRARSKKMRTLMKRGLMPRGVLTQLTRHITLRDLDDVLNHLVVSDLVAMGEVDGMDVLWSKT